MVSDLGFCGVPSAGFEPATHGLGIGAGAFRTRKDRAEIALDLRLLRWVDVTSEGCFLFSCAPSVPRAGYEPP
jgi:hypothetical protein